jgi:hypothetical protein
MPTISQLPLATSVSSSDAVPVSQDGTARSTSVGLLLASTQPAIVVQSPALIGRTSLGSGGPEQISIGLGVALSEGTLTANGRDHAGFPALSSLTTNADLVVSNDGTPMLMQASLLRGLFSAGQNVTIGADGTISAAGAIAGPGSASAVGDLQIVSTLDSQDLVAARHAGADCAITYGNLLGGVTIDQAQFAGPVSDSDTIWAAQGSNVMTSQNFGAIWAWAAKKLPTYRPPVTEVTTSLHLDMTVHNGRILICSQPVTLTPLLANMGSGFQCTVINVSVGDITLDAAFISSTGGLTLGPRQSALIYCASYSGGTIAFASITESVAAMAPGQVTGLSGLSTTPTTITISWQPPQSGTSASSYTVQYRQTGSLNWSSVPSIVGVTAYELHDLQSATAYDIVVQAVNAAGSGLSSAILSLTTSASAQPALPARVSGLSVTPASSSTMQINWSAQTGAAAATSFTVQFRATGSSSWTSSIAGVSETSTTLSGLLATTSYDVCVFGVNASGAGPASSTVTAATLSVPNSVTAITWNLLPSGTYTHASGAIGVNAHVSPVTSAVRFGFALSATTRPTSWTAGVLVNSDLWGAYVPTPATAGNWYAWAEGTDGSAPTVGPSPFVVQ